MNGVIGHDSALELGSNSSLKHPKLYTTIHPILRAIFEQLRQDIQDN